MFERLQDIEKQADELRIRQADPEVAVDPKQSREIAQKLAGIQPVVDVFRDYRGVETDLEGAKELLAGLGWEDVGMICISSILA